MADARRDVFGRLLVDPARLARPERVNELRKLAAAMQDGKPDKLAAAWLGKALQDWLQFGGDIAEHLGVRPSRGSNLTAQRQIAKEAQDRALVRLAMVCGSDRAALAALHGHAPWPVQAEDLRDALAGAPKYAAAISRARTRLSRHGSSGEHV
jgi:hypothetical protein